MSSKTRSRFVAAALACVGLTLVTTRIEVGSFLPASPRSEVAARSLSGGYEGGEFQEEEDAEWRSGGGGGLLSGGVVGGFIESILSGRWGSSSDLSRGGGDGGRSLMERRYASADCNWTRPPRVAPPPTGVEGTFLVSFPGSGKRLTSEIIKFIVADRAGDDWDHSFRGYRQLAFLKGSYPHHESQPWWWPRSMRQTILQVRNPRWAVPSYRSMRYELQDAIDWPLSHEAAPRTYTRRRPLAEFNDFRDYPGLLEYEVRQWGWMIDFWMEGGLRREYANHELENGVETYNERCRTPDHPDRNLECKPVLVVSYESLNHNRTGPRDVQRIADALRGMDGVSVLNADSWDCTWNIITQYKKTPNQKRDGRGPPADAYTYNSTQILLINTEIKRVLDKYSNPPWDADPIAGQLLEHVLNYLGDNNAALADALTIEGDCASEGVQCSNVYPCDGSPCQNGGTCPGIRPNEDGSGYVHQCEGCNPGYEGHSCQVEIDECARFLPCQNGADCVDEINDYTCVCVPGFEGKDCEIDIDECERYQMCQNGATCIDEVNDYQCVCPPGYEGRDCEVNINECELYLPCRNGATCVDEINGYTCVCPPGYEGKDCEINIDECASAACLNGASCVDGVNAYTCECAPGYTGTHCEVDIDECAQRPCLNGAGCADGVNGYTCTCAPGYNGTHCENDIDECATNPCQNGANCVNEVNDYTCECVAGFEGKDCETDIDECEPQPCLHGGTCHDGLNKYTCLCPEGYRGTNCEINIDECAGNPCLNGGTCVDGINQYTCQCAPGYEGSNCETDTDDCDHTHCLNGATCVDGVNGYSCECAPGYSGTHCEINTDDCAGDPCLNGATCVDGVDGYTCQCAPGYEGTNCETEIDECASQPCLNGATCVDGVDSYTCQCAPGYEGTNCENEINA